MSVVKRPISVSIIAWINLVGGGLSIAFTPTYLFSSSDERTAATIVIPPLVNVIMAVIWGTVSVVSGILMFRGKNLGRLLYLFYTPVSLAIYTFFMLSSPLVWFNAFSVVFYIAILFFLFSRPASAYFSGSPASETMPIATQQDIIETLTTIPIEKVSTNRRIAQILRKTASIILLSFSGFYLAAIMLVSVPLYAYSRPGEAPLGVVGIVAFFVFILLIGGVVMGGLALWGLRLWRKMLGIFFVSTGGILIVFVGPMLLLMFLIPAGALGISPVGYNDFVNILKLLALGSGTWGPICLAIGIPLLAVKRKPGSPSFIKQA